ncbi:MAG: thiamine biosynthesis protein ApbE [Treponema sp.]|nr:MAG: thiamine biosynthesis protein ApbE [Treponema sp.]
MINTIMSVKPVASKSMQKIKKSLFYFLFVCFISVTFVSCKPKQQSEFVLGTFCLIKVEYHKNAEAALKKAFERLYEIDGIFNANTDTSELADINKTAFKKPVKVSDELYSVLSTACEFAQKTNSAFNPAMGKIIKLWNIGFDNASVPDDFQIKENLKYAVYQNIELKHGYVFLKDERTKIDLGAIVKGFAADEVAKILREEGIKNAIINLGGNVYAIGNKKTSGSKKTKWKIGIRSPFKKNADLAFVLTLENQTVVTSGTYERFFESNGKKYHHILDSQTGYPVENNLVSVTIISDKSIIADALSTSCFALGYEKSLDLLKGFSNTEAVFIFKDGSYKITDEKLQIKIESKEN